MGDVYLEGTLLGVASEGLGPGVICSLRDGDSGRREGLLGFFSPGLVERPMPGPTDLLNAGSDGVGGVKFVEFWLPTFRPPKVLAVGVCGNELAEEPGGESRLTAFVTGRKIPAPGKVVVKYETLGNQSQPLFLKREPHENKCTYPSTSPEFFPRCENSGCSSTPAKVPFFP